MTCARDDCHRRARWRPILVLVLPGETTPCQGVLTMGLCDEHRADVETGGGAALLTDPGWELICDGFRVLGRALPVRAQTTIEWQPLDGAATLH